MKSLSSFYLGYFVPASTLIPIVAGLLYYKKINTPLRTLLVYLIASFIINVAGIILADHHINNLPLLHFYTIIEIVAIMLYYLKAFGPGKIHKWIKGIMILFPLLCIVNFCFFQSIYEFNTYTRPLEALIIILITGCYFTIQHDLKNSALITRSGRLVAAGFMIYFCSSLFQFIFSNIVSQKASGDIKLFIWDIHATFVLIMYLLFFRAIIDERNKRQY
ncbi:hypothetical protein [Mucilaginibacter segetis]|uniref:Uncharacterized protein n=1 Tax=Mucilaginibacter segetis TaxID=2793071 RepID=A0A934UMR3_9SPHI|nr:hypothetical protein [Mucilaginibacter segetis]MBK0379162.1 hypothetical protein [Mucilaginibacter segetis]